jgi:hypothetical protein
LPSQVSAIADKINSSTFVEDTMKVKALPLNVFVPLLAYLSDCWVKTNNMLVVPRTELYWCDSQYFAAIVCDTLEGNRRELLFFFGLDSIASRTVGPFAMHNINRSGTARQILMLVITHDRMQLSHCTREVDPLCPVSI